MSKAIKLKNNLYLDTRGIVHNKKILNTILFPIGYVYLSVNNTNPGTIFGGTWEQISGYYLYLGTGGTKTNYTGIGTQNHTLTVDQIPPHTHNWYAAIDGGSDAGRQIDRFMLNGWGNARWWPNLYKMDNTGGGQGHSHNIATFQVYAWKRVS